MSKSPVLYVDMNVSISTINGVDTDLNLAVIIGEAIAGCGAEQCKTLKPTKLIGWAEKLAMKEQLPLDETDFDLLREFVSLLPKLNINVLVQAERCFKAAKEKKSE